MPFCLGSDGVTTDEWLLLLRQWLAHPGPQAPPQQRVQVSHQTQAQPLHSNSATCCEYDCDDDGCDCDCGSDSCHGDDCGSDAESSDCDCDFDFDVGAYVDAWPGRRCWWRRRYTFDRDCEFVTAALASL
jgi:hypothetical protein